MSGPNDSTNSGSNACIVCYRNAEIYSIGMCEHPVCYECSTRMRVLCQQNECPICRQDLPKVVFSKEVKPFRFLKKGTLLDNRYNIYFDSPEVQEKFIKLLTHKCSVCEDNQVFSSFNSLKDHMRRKHDLHYCELCVDNLKIFSHERRCYSRTELSRHRRKGDVDDKSHKGHPLCEFCDQRYMDNDELYRHLRRDHLFCHFCDADGLHQYYSSYDFLRDHFQKEHYLCEEGGCADEQFTSVFRTDIDLKAHKSSVHGKQLGKAAAKQARTLELEFTLAPRGDPRNRRGFSGPPRTYPEPAVPEQAVIPPEPPTFVRQPLVDVQSTQEFPTLGNSAPCFVPNLTGGGSGRKGGGSNLTIRGTLRQGNYDQNFPALGPEALASGPAASGNASGTGVAKTLNFSVTSSSNNTASAAARRQPNATPNLSIHVNHRPNGTVTTRLSGPNLRVQPGSSRDADFPALGRSGVPTTTSSSSSSAQTQASWTKVTCVKSMPQTKGKKVAPPPLPPSPPPLRSGEDFPSLSKPSKAKGQQQSVQSASSWVQAHSSEPSTNASSLMTDATKGKAKKKKKQQTMANMISNGNTSSNESSSSAKTSSREPDNANGPGKKKSKDAEPSKKDKSKTLVKQNSEQKSSSNGSDNNQSQQQTSFNTSSPASTPTQRKRSELKIESLNTNNNNNISKSANPSKPEDFPALGRRPPPGLASPPPGFTAPATVAPPPGFMSRLNGLTFTNSSGESYTIVPDEAEQKQQRNTSSSSSSSNSTQYTYLPPANFQKRNQNLIAEFNACFGSQESEELKAFRYISGLFRTGDCDANEYYKQCRVVMGAEAFKRVFPELLALLPDIDKQRELFKVHKRETSSGGRGMKGLEACGTCGQILRESDLKAHCTSHTLENHFPALRTGPALAGSAGAWAKK